MPPGYWNVIPCSLSASKEATVVQWICLHLPHHVSCSPRFESQAHPLYFFRIYLFLFDWSFYLSLNGEIKHKIEKKLLKTIRMLRHECQAKIDAEKINISWIGFWNWSFLVRPKIFHLCVVTSSSTMLKVEDIDKEKIM